MIKDKLKYEEDLLDGYARDYTGKWVGLFFHVDGRAFCSKLKCRIFDTEGETLEDIKDVFHGGWDDISFGGGPIMPISDFTHAIPMPAGDS